jgi:tRNA-dihydrouridine synthase A
MMDWTDRHCRYFHRLLAPHARLYTEMVVTQAVIFGDRHRLLGFDPSEQPVALQLGGSDPPLLAQAAKIGADLGYAEINLNCGCPSDRVQAGRFGACLMLEPELVAECVSAMRAAVSVPVTVKCRLGVDQFDSYEGFLHFIDAVAAAGCTVFTVHARKAWLKGLSPKENREKPPLWYDRVHRLKAERPHLSVVLNGGLDQVQPCMDALIDLDGVMLGRAAYHDPYLLAVLDQQLFGTPLPDRMQVLAHMQDYIERMQLPARHVNRHLLGLFQGVPGVRQWRQALTQGAMPLQAAQAAMP